MPTIRELDVHHLGLERVICCFAVDDVLVDPGPESSHRELLRQLGDEVPRAILLTHIHLDHAGATGALVRRWPDVEVWVHERGAPHLVDPSRLVASARRLYGDEFDELWGEVVPVPEGNLRVLRGDEAVGEWRVRYTPGHASHHVCYLHEPTGVVFAGDVGGVRIGAGPVIVPTPPPDIDLEAWGRSLDALAAWRPQALARTHFGTWPDPEAELAAARESLKSWGELGRVLEEEAFVARMRAAVTAHEVDALTAAAYEQASPPGHDWAGLHRYWGKRVPSQA